MFDNVFEPYFDNIFKKKNYELKIFILQKVKKYLSVFPMVLLTLYHTIHFFLEPGSCSMFTYLFLLSDCPGLVSVMTHCVCSTILQREGHRKT